MVSNRLAKFLYLLLALGWVLANSGCAMIDLRDFNIRFDAGNGILLPGQSIIIRSDIPLNHPSLEQGFQLVNVNDSSIARTEFVWVGDQEAHVNSVGPLLAGRKYMAKFKGTISDAAQNKQQDLMVLQTYIYQTTDSIPVLINQVPTSGTATSIHQNIVLTFNMPMDLIKLQKAFSITPPTELVFSITPDNLVLTISPKTNWEAVQKYDWTLASDACSTNGIPITDQVIGWFQTTLNAQALTLESIACGTYDMLANAVSATTPVYAQSDSDTTLDIATKYKDCLVFSFQNTAVMDPKSFISAITIDPKVEGLFFQPAGSQIVFQPKDGWDQETLYKITVTASLRDMNGNAPIKSTEYFMRPNIASLRIATVTIQSDTAIIIPDTDYPKFPVIHLIPRGAISPFYFDVKLDFDMSRLPVPIIDHQKILDSIKFEGYIPLGSNPVLDQFSWSNGGQTLLLNYRNILKSDVVVPNTDAYYRLSISAGLANIMSDGRYMPKPIEIVVRSDHE